MVYRKGELSKGTINRQWPHLPFLSDSCTGAQWGSHSGVLQGHVALSGGHFFYRDTIGFNVYCFGEREHAEHFRSHFNGELITPEEQPRWPRKR